MSIDYEIWEIKKERKKNYGVGYSSKEEDNETDVINSKIYKVWGSIMFKTYSVVKEIHETKQYTICKEWLDFSKFKEWYINNYYEILGKPSTISCALLIPGNSLYSPSTCVFAPIKLQNIVKPYQRKSYKPTYGIRNKKKGIYEISITVFPKKENNTDSGIFTCNKHNLDDAILLRNFCKEFGFVATANSVKEFIPNKLYETICSYRINSHDGKINVDYASDKITLYNLGYIKKDNFYCIDSKCSGIEKFREWEKTIYSYHKDGTKYEDIPDYMLDYYKYIQK